MAKKSKILKSPNSYGGVVKMGNASRRRRPYIVRVTTGYEYNEETGKSTQKYGIIGYAKTREEGLMMLAKYHEQPYDLSKGNYTFREIYELWSEEKYENASNSTIAGYRAAYNACTILYEQSFRDLKTKDLQNVIDTCGKNYPTLKNIKILFNQLFAYAMKNELCAKDISKYVDISKYSEKNPNRLVREVFSKDKIDILWKNSNDAYYQMVLILIYTGVRIQELLDLKKNMYILMNITLMLFHQKLKVVSEKFLFQIISIHSLKTGIFLRIMNICFIPKTSNLLNIEITMIVTSCLSWNKLM